MNFKDYKIGQKDIDKFLLFIESCMLIYGAINESDLKKILKFYDIKIHTTGFAFFSFIISHQAFLTILPVLKKISTKTGAMKAPATPI